MRVSFQPVQSRGRREGKRYDALVRAGLAGPVRPTGAATGLGVRITPPNLWESREKRSPKGAGRDASSFIVC